MTDKLINAVLLGQTLEIVEAEALARLAELDAVPRDSSCEWNAARAYERGRLGACHAVRLALGLPIPGWAGKI